MRYFVTGATGFIGGQVARMLREEGHSVVAIVRDPARASSLASLGVELHPGDVTDKESLREPMRGADGVFHIAGWYKLGTRPEETAQGWRINVDGTRNTLEVMRELEILKGVYTSTLAVFSDTKGELPDESYRYNGPHLTAYDRSKWAAHYEVAEPMAAAGLPLVTVQPGVVYGSGDHSGIRNIFVQFLQRRLPVIPRKTAYCWAHVEDTARGCLLAMEKGRLGESYIIAGPPHTLVETLRMASEITGLPVPRAISPGVLATATAFVGGLEKVGARLPDLTSEGLTVVAGRTYIGDNTKAKRELGFAPRPLREGLEETLRHEMRLLGMTQPPLSV